MPPGHSAHFQPRDARGRFVKMGGGHGPVRIARGEGFFDDFVGGFKKGFSGVLRPFSKVLSLVPHPDAQIASAAGNALSDLVGGGRRRKAKRKLRKLRGYVVPRGNLRYRPGERILPGEIVQPKVRFAPRHMVMTLPKRTRPYTIEAQLFPHQAARHVKSVKVAGGRVRRRKI